MNLKYNRKPLFFNTSSQMKVSNENYEMFLDINQKDIINDIGYTTLEDSPEFKTEFELISNSALGLNLSEITKIKNPSKEKPSLPLFMLHDAIQKFTNENIVLVCKDDLICRCYNQSEKDLLDAFNKGDKSLFTLSNTTKASTGCGSCKLDIEALIRTFGGEKSKLLNKTNSEWVLFFDNIINDYYINKEKKINIVKFKDFSLFLNAKEKDLELEKYLLAKSPIQLSVFFSPSP